MLEILKQELKNFKSPLYRNSIYISLASLTTAVAGFLFWAIAARLYPAKDVGVASAIVSALNLTFNLSMLGMNFAIIRFYPEYKERAIGSALIITSIASVAFSVAYGLIMICSGSFGDLGWGFVGVFVLFSVIGTLYNVLYTYSVARRRAEHGFVQSLLFAGRFVFLFLLIGMGLLGILLSFGLGLFFGLFYVLLFVDFKSLLVIDLDFLRESFRFAFGNYIIGLSNIAPAYIMPTLLLLILSKEEVAYYYIASMVGMTFLLVLNAINTSFFVEGSYNCDILKTTLKKAIFISYVYLGGAFTFVLALGDVILGLFGEKYIAGTALLWLIILSGFLSIPANFLITTLNILRLVKKATIISVLKSFLSILFSYLFVLKYGITGVGLGINAAYLVILVIILIIYRDTIQPVISS